MKKGLILFLVTLVALNMQAEKLTIVHEDWAEAQKMAKESNKKIIIDFYTTWCGPCKMFSANLAKNEELQLELNENFIMLKYDAEKDKKFNLTKKFHVRAYPTFVVVSADGQYADRLAGGALENDESVVRFMNFAFEASNILDAGNYPTGYNLKFDNPYPEFYVKSMNREGKFDNRQLEQYWKKHTDYTSEVNFAVMSSFGGSDQANEYYLKNKEKFQEKFGNTAANQILERMVNRKYAKAVKAKSEKLFEEAKKFALEHLGEKGANIDYMNYRFAMATKNCALVDSAISTFIEKNEMSAGGINSICWQLYESDCSDRMLIEKAIKWMAGAKPSEQGYAFLDTYACILFKNKRYTDARNYMEQAIAEATKSGEKHDASTKMLGKIEEALKN